MYLITIILFGLMFQYISAYRPKNGSHLRIYVAHHWFRDSRSRFDLIYFESEIVIRNEAIAEFFDTDPLFRNPEWTFFRCYPKDKPNMRG